MKTPRPSDPHRFAEREAVKRARYHLKHKEYERSIVALLYALEQSTAADVKDAWWDKSTASVSTKADRPAYSSKVKR